MNILFITPYYRPYLGGIERIISNLSLSLNERDDINDISILTTKSNYPSGDFNFLPDYERNNGIDIYRINFFPKNLPFLYHSYNAGIYSKDLFRIVDFISPDLIHMCKIEWYIPNYLITKKYSNK